MYIKVDFGVEFIPVPANQPMNPVVALQKFDFYGYDCAEVADSEAASAYVEDLLNSAFAECQLPNGVQTIYKDRVCNCCHWADWKEIDENTFKALVFH